MKQTFQSRRKEDNYMNQTKSCKQKWVNIEENQKVDDQKLQRQHKKVEDPSLIRSLKGHLSIVNRLRFNPNNRQIGSVDKQGYAYFFDFRQDHRPYKYNFSDHALYDIMFQHKHNRVLICGEDKKIRIIKNRINPNSKDVKELINNTIIRGMDSNIDENMLISFGDDKIIKLWDLKKFKFMQTFKGHNNIIRSAVFSPDSRMMVSGGDDKYLRMWDIEKNKQVFVVQAHNDQINRVVYNTNHMITTCSDDGSIRTFDSRSENLVQHYQGNQGSIKGICISPDELSIASCGNSVKIWDIRQGILDYTLYGHQGTINDVCYSYDGQYLASAGEDKVIHIYQNSHKKIPNQDNLQQQQQFKHDSQIMVSQEEEQILMKINRITNYFDTITKRLQELNVRLRSNESKIESLIHNDIISGSIKQNVKDTMQFEQKSFKSVWEQFNSIQSNQQLMSFMESLKHYPNQQLFLETLQKQQLETKNQEQMMKQMTIDRLNVRDDFSDEEIENAFGQSNIDIDQNEMDLRQTLNQKELKQKLLQTQEYINQDQQLKTGFNQTFNLENNE